MLTRPQATALRRRAARDVRAARVAHARARKLRDALDSLFRAVASGRRPPAGSIETLRRAYVDGVDRGRLGYSRGRFAWEATDAAGLDAVTHLVARAATELLLSEDLRRVKRCGECLWLFLDASKNRSRRWCNMENCGPSVKKRRYVARRAARRAQARGRALPSTP